ncbi:hypothetical protein [Mucilaginibacter polytrichastri]|uniref:hypothetical protein n=1 Tax=Mucilaginibacter polytrichastri TaxID=1302689 RepID=UPI000ADFCCED|nr:hypothetical protein [Mucilaginibacter polytrichastri]
MVKPFHNGSWVGLGFNLTAGGSITRVVNDKPDDCSWYNSSVLFTNEVHGGFFYNHGFMASAAWASSGNLTNAINDLRNYGLKNITQNYGYFVVKDYAPDEFSFTIGELSGTFYMDENGNFKVRCNEKVKVVIGSGDILSVPTPPLPGTPAFGSLPAIPPTPLPNQTYLNRITLIDTKGVQYVFGGAANSIEFGTTCPKTWYITSITTTNGKTINYSYQAGQAVSYNLPGYYGTYQDGLGGRIIFQEPTPAVKSEYLKEIRTDDQVITFFSSYNNPNEFSKLDSIKVNSLSNGSEVWNFAFEYINTPMDRLKLVDFYQKDLNGQTNNKYAFTYNALQIQEIKFVRMQCCQMGHLL